MPDEAVIAMTTPDEPAVEVVKPAEPAVEAPPGGRGTDGDGGTG